VITLDSKPLANFPLVRSRSIEEVSDAIGRVYARPVLTTAPGAKTLDATFNNCRLRHVEIAYAAFGAAVTLDFPASGYFSQILPLHGSGELDCGGGAVAMAAGVGAAVTAHAAHVSRFSADYEHLVLRIEARALAEKLEALTGTAIAEPLRLSHETKSGQHAAQLLQHYLPVLVGTVGSARPPFPDWWIAQTEQLVMTLFLFGYRHNYSHLLAREVPDSAPWQVRRAEDYIAAHADREITLEELAAVTGVSAFSLFRSFKKSRGYSPSEFVSRLRAKRGATP